MSTVNMPSSYCISVKNRRRLRLVCSALVLPTAHGRNRPPSRMQDVECQMLLVYKYYNYRIVRTVRGDPARGC